jgi:hypothetical protein
MVSGRRGRRLINEPVIGIMQSRLGLQRRGRK